MTATHQDRVLVVDDTDAVRDVVALVLEERGYQVIQAASGPEALEAVEADKPSLILLDLHMPGMDGFAVITALHDEFERPRVPVILFSADATEPVKLRAVRLGASGFLVKGTADLDVLLSTVAIHLGR